MKRAKNGNKKRQTALKRFALVYNIELTALISFLNSICCCVCPYFVLTTLNIYTHLDWSSKENAAKAMENAVKLPENTTIENPWNK